jgi:molybdenum cofactor cytidylyltransferase
MIAAVLLAAGYSTRMGCPKALLEWRGRTFLATIHTHLAAASVRPIVVVTGAATDEIMVAHTGLTVTWARNPDPSRGMLSSLRCGMRAQRGAAEEIDAVMLCLIDHPAVDPSTYVALATRATRDTIVIPTHDGRRGHPVIFGQAFFGELLEGDCTEGARSVVRAHADAVCELPLDDIGILTDIDTPDEYNAARA